MSKEKQHKHSEEPVEEQDTKTTAEEAPEVMDILDEDEGDGTQAEADIAENARLQNELDEALRQVEKDKQDYLMLMADFDNYRKRMLREKADLLKNAAERTLLGLLPIVDDFERGLAASTHEDGEAMRKGMELIYNKLIKYLESNGVKAMESTGAPFDADLHEAIAAIPAPSEELKGVVIDTTQKGYMINDKVLRHAKVAVGE
ncbi:MAG: nucleotide exchange factor GrpE [Muribaculaceae bacterium]|nr:nucleotide exchange factor GrpE [Muribaculaceae bacterium]